MIEQNTETYIPPWIAIAISPEMGNFPFVRKWQLIWENFLLWVLLIFPLENVYLLA